MCFPSMFIQIIVDIYRSKSKDQKLFFPLFIFQILRFLELSEFPSVELVHIKSPTTYLRQRQVQVRSAESSTRTSRRPQGDDFTTFGVMPTVEETYVDPTTAMNPIGHAEDVDPLVAPPLSLRAMMQSIMTN